jgi:hypothetical protein
MQATGLFMQSPYLDMHGEVDVSMRYVYDYHLFEISSHLFCMVSDAAADNICIRPDGERSAEFG